MARHRFDIANRRGILARILARHFCLCRRKQRLVQRNGASESPGCKLRSKFDAADAACGPRTRGSGVTMPQLLEHPDSLPAPVTEVIHGITVADPYRWLEDQHSAATRAWLEAQSRYASSYFESIHVRRRIRECVRALLDIETCDCFQRVRDRYFFRKRLPGDEQPGIYFREGWTGEDQLLLDPATFGGGSHIAVKPLQVSPDGRLLLYEVKEGGERTGRFELLDVETRRKLRDALPRGYLRGFVFTPDARGFYYVHETADTERPNYRAAYHHVLGTSLKEDREIFFAGESEHLRLHLAPVTAVSVFSFTDSSIKPTSTSISGNWSRTPAWSSCSGRPPTN